MKKISHKTANASHYDLEADTYDLFNEKRSKRINRTITSILKRYKVNSVLDLACGTGSQVFWLAERGYAVIGVDINAKMLGIAKRKASKMNKAHQFIQGDMRTTKAGRFDAVVTIFNAIGHLTKRDFERSIKNIADNLNPGGIYIFDIFNLSYLLKDDHITKLTIDWLKKSDIGMTREIQYSTIDDDGLLASYDLYITQTGKSKPVMKTTSQTLQVYNAAQLKTMLNRGGFKVVELSNIDGSRFSDTKSERLMVVAKKKES